MKLSAIAVASSVAITLSFTVSAMAQQRPNAARSDASEDSADAAALLSNATRLTRYQIERELGRRTNWAANLLTYDREDGRFRQLVGYQVYYDLKTQEALTPQDVQHLRALAAQRDADHVTVK